MAYADESEETSSYRAQQLLLQADGERIEKERRKERKKDEFDYGASDCVIIIIYIIRCFSLPLLIIISNICKLFFPSLLLLLLLLLQLKRNKTE